MSALRELLERHVDDGTVPGAVALVARGGELELEAVGWVDLERSAPIRPDSIFRIASITKPITAAAVMLLVDDGLLALDEPIGRRLPELAHPVVVRTPSSPVDDLVPAARPITVEDVLTFRAGWGFPSDFSLPAVQPLLEAVGRFMRSPRLAPPPDEWLAWLAGIPLLHQPGEAWLYNTCADLQGVLVERVSGRPFAAFLRERLLEPLGMRDTGFEIPADRLARFTSFYGADPGGGPALVDRPDGAYRGAPALASGAGGLVSTAADWLAFGRMLLAGGGGLLSPESVRRMTTDHLTREQREAAALFLEGRGWGYGGSVDLETGRYGWVGGTGTAAHVDPASGTVAILLTQREMAGPTPTPTMREFWRHAFPSL